MLTVPLGFFVGSQGTDRNRRSCWPGRGSGLYLLWSLYQPIASLVTEVECIHHTPPRDYSQSALSTHEAVARLPLASMS